MNSTDNSVYCLTNICQTCPVETYTLCWSQTQVIDLCTVVTGWNLRTYEVLEVRLHDPIVSSGCKFYRSGDEAKETYSSCMDP